MPDGSISAMSPRAPGVPWYRPLPPIGLRSCLLDAGCCTGSPRVFLIHVLAESTTGPRGVRIDTAILADPYVERGQARRRLFPAQPVISASYLNQDPSSAGAPDWRKFFEEAGAKGKIDVRPSESHVSRWESRTRCRVPRRR